MTRKGRRLLLIGLAGAVLATAMGLVLTALNDTIVFFNAPTQIIEHPPTPGTRLRLGGLVENGSVARQGPDVKFSVTDGANKVQVNFKGLLPDLFREGQGVIAEGSLGADGVFAADTVLAKHDETYMPKEVADALKKQGVWKGGETK
ncbi:cytochrome c-type biogenesis protein CcmE [Terrihabitans soli]|uniref:Cytochrome c-type biogenesis protein CcmE n=1 Tax=Terrihabitans soli TaxID=708113 RepID=A0A6S6QRC5_9HYPH|nr:cytochrome c maturation protein CcmE [Terrihabitans soli]BCJ90295.1 cytochrome c-type biogenesis protein CcmE [Terrihabitans soli]